MKVNIGEALRLMKAHPRVKNTGVISVKIELSDWVLDEQRLQWSLYAADAKNDTTACSDTCEDFDAALLSLIEKFDRNSRSSLVED